MAVECQSCGRKAQMYLCSPCEQELKETLEGLPRWLDFLHDAATGQTRLGESARRAPGDNFGPIPFHERASELYDNAHQLLEKWVQVINHNYEQLGQP
jgi:hypothetical protein